MTLLRIFPGMLPMQLGVQGELRVFLLSMAVGAALGLLYQVLRLLRAALPHCRAAVFVQDLLFGLLCGFCWFLVFSFYSLSMRWFIAFGMGLAALTVHFVIGKPLVSAAARLFGVIRGFLAKTARKIRGRFV